MELLELASIVAGAGSSSDVRKDNATAPVKHTKPQARGLFAKDGGVAVTGPSPFLTKPDSTDGAAFT